MSKKNKNKQKQRQTAQRNANNASAAVPKSTPPKQDAPPITMDDLAASTSQTEFEKNREAIFNQVLEEIAEWEKTKADAEQAAKEAKRILEEFEREKEEKTRQRDELQGQIDSIQADYNNAEQTVKAAEQKAEETKSSADEYADEVRKEADAERLATLKKASDEAKAAWQKQVDDLSNQIQDIADREAALLAGQRQLEKDKRDIEDEKEAINDLKEYLQKQKNRYDAASPEKIAALEMELADETSKYQALHTRYHEQTERLNSLQVTLDTIIMEIPDSENGVRKASLNEIVSSLQEIKDKYERIAAIYKRYPDDNAIAALEEKAKETDRLERENEALQQERKRYRDEVVAARNVNRELEIVKQEVEATNALNEHLLQELESHKTALESRTGDTCPALTKVDTEVEEQGFIEDVENRVNRISIESLEELVTHVKNYAGSRKVEQQLYYTDNDIRAFLAGLSVSRLLILQGMSGTGKSSLPRIFSEAISGFNRLIPVESSWRDRNELLGYYNDFNKKFNAKSFTIELYRSSKDRCQDIPTFIVLDEMNLARIEYYFSDFLAILQEPDHEKWLIELVSSDMRTLPMELPEELKEKMRKESPTVYSIWEKIERSRQGDLKAETSDEDKEKLTAYLDKLGQLTGAKSLIDGRKIKVTDNIWFIGTANRDESTFEISDKVYDRAQVVSLNRKGVSEGKYPPTSAKFISVQDLEDLFEDAIRKNKTANEVENRLNDLDNVLMEKFDVSFGNRIVTQTINFAAVFVAAGGSLDDALDYQISTKILRKVITSDDEEALFDLEIHTEKYKETQRLIRKRIKELS